jgi:hypothetical protein
MKSNKMKKNKNKQKYDINKDPEEPTVMGYVVGFFDVLGFKELHKQHGSKKLIEIYQELIVKVIIKNVEDMQAFTLVRFNNVKVPAIGTLPIRYTYFSDTILLWIPLVEYLIEGFAVRCSDLIIEGLNIGIPIRGSISVGGAVMNKEKSIFLGEPLIEAALLEKAQNWIGVSYGPSATHPKFQDALGQNYVIQFYTKHYKPNNDNLISQMVLDWPRRMRDNHDPKIILNKLQELRSKTDKTIKYDNTFDFIKYSEQNQNWFKTEVNFEK